MWTSTTLVPGSQTPARVSRAPKTPLRSVWTRALIGLFVVAAAASLALPGLIITEATLSYLGFGVRIPIPSWGNMLNGAQQYLASAPWLAIVPGVAITLAVTGFNFVGDGLRDALDARSDLG